jgi:phosphorylase kinase alpha/beta subunit
MKSLMSFYRKYKRRFTDIIERRVDPTNPMNRPHVRFDGDHLQELPEKWSHAQNDALGAFLWLAAKLADECHWSAEERELLATVARYLAAIRYWTDEDSGHWEESRKISASSIGVATAALEARDNAAESDSLRAGHQALRKILPSECIQSDPAKCRRYDSALLFLIYPYQIVTGEMADLILADVKSQLLGPYGIRRYLGDSYWCADYKQKLAADVRTADFSDNLESRDRFLQPGFEAQWCLFDPIISISYGLRFQRTHDAEDHRQRMWHLNRSLSQLTVPGSRFGAYRCPESYFCEQGVYVPNDICPLLWTQANLKMALTQLIRSLSAN